MATDAARPVFLDSNVIVYVFSADTGKAERSEALIEQGGFVSVQVLNEAAYVLRRKFKADWTAINDMSASCRANLTVVPVTSEVHLRGLALAERYQLQLFDGMIVAAAQLAGCATLYSEDMNSGMAIDGLTILNPYR